MSRRYPETRECPGCGLDVAWSSTDGFRPHGQRAINAGAVDSECALTVKVGRKRDQYREAQERRREAAPRRREFWDSRDPESSLPKHLR